MDLSSIELHVFVSLTVILGTALVALVVDYLKGNNENLREYNIELRVRREEETRRSLTEIRLLREQMAANADIVTHIERPWEPEPRPEPVPVVVNVAPSPPPAQATPEIIEQAVQRAVRSATLEMNGAEPAEAAAVAAPPETEPHREPSPPVAGVRPLKSEPAPDSLLDHVIFATLPASETEAPSPEVELEQVVIYAKKPQEPRATEPSRVVFLAPVEETSEPPVPAPMKDSATAPALPETGPRVVVSPSPEVVEEAAPAEPELASFLAPAEVPQPRDTKLTLAPSEVKALPRSVAGIVLPARRGEKVKATVAELPTAPLVQKEIEARPRDCKGKQPEVRDAAPVIADSLPKVVIPRLAVPAGRASIRRPASAGLSPLEGSLSPREAVGARGLELLPLAPAEPAPVFGSADLTVTSVSRPVEVEVPAEAVAEPALAGEMQLPAPSPAIPPAPTPALAASEVQTGWRAIVLPSLPGQTTPAAFEPTAAGRFELPVLENSAAAEVAPARPLSSADSGRPQVRPAFPLSARDVTVIEPLPAGFFTPLVASAEPGAVSGTRTLPLPLERPEGPRLVFSSGLVVRREQTTETRPVLVKPLVERPRGFCDAAAIDKLDRDEAPIAGVVVAIGINDYERVLKSQSKADARSLNDAIDRLVRSMLGPDDFAYRRKEDEYLLVLAGERGAAAQKRIHQVAERLWDFQLRSLTTFSVLFSWGAVTVDGESFPEAVALAVEEMNETRDSRKGFDVNGVRARRRAVNF